MTDSFSTDSSLTRDFPFGYRCHACGRCCREYRIQVNPYEVLRLARHLVCRIYPLCRRLSAAGEDTFTRIQPVAGSEAEHDLAGYLQEQGAFDSLAATDR